MTAFISERFCRTPDPAAGASKPPRSRSRACGPSSVTRAAREGARAFGRMTCALTRRQRGLGAYEFCRRLSATWPLADPVIGQVGLAFRHARSARGAFSRLGHPPTWPLARSRKGQPIWGGSGPNARAQTRRRPVPDPCQRRPPSSAQAGAPARCGGPRPASGGGVDEFRDYRTRGRNFRSLYN